MLEGSVRRLRAPASAAGRPELPIAAMVKLESVLYGAHRMAVEAIPATERAVPLIAVDDRDGARTRAAREVAAGADAVVLKPGLVTLDLVTRVSESVDRPVISFFTADEHAFFTASDDSRDLADAARETFRAAQRAGADRGRPAGGDRRAGARGTADRGAHASAQARSDDRAASHPRAGGDHDLARDAPGRVPDARAHERVTASGRARAARARRRRVGRRAPAQCGRGARPLRLPRRTGRDGA